MEIIVKRIALKDKYTIGRMTIDGEYFCDVLEDKVIDLDKSGKFDGKEKKVYGESAVPYGKYKVTLTLSPRFKRFLPEIHNVPHFTGIRIHSGNFASDSHGCLLVGENKEVGKVLNSRYWEKQLVAKMKGYADEITIEII